MQLNRAFLGGSFLLLSCNLAMAQQSVLICEGQRSSIVNGFGGAEIETITLTKVSGKVVKAVDKQGNVYTAAKQREKGEGNPVYTQLLVQPDQIILRVENSGMGRTFDLTISNTGAYRSENPMGTSVGICTPRAKAF